MFCGVRGGRWRSTGRYLGEVCGWKFALAAPAPPAWLWGQKRHHGGGAYEWSLHGSSRIDENPSLLCHIFACYCYALSQFMQVVTAVETEKKRNMNG